MYYFLMCCTFFTENIQTREWNKCFILEHKIFEPSYSFSKDLSCTFPNWSSGRPTFGQILARVNQNSRSHNRYVTRKEFVWKEDAGAKGSEAWHMQNFKLDNCNLRSFFHSFSLFFFLIPYSHDTCDSPRCTTETEESRRLYK